MPGLGALWSPCWRMIVCDLDELIINKIYQAVYVQHLTTIKLHSFENDGAPIIILKIEKEGGCFVLI